MTNLFIQVRFLDIIDILLVTIIFFEIYKLVKGTVAFNIFMGIFIIFIVWLDLCIKFIILPDKDYP